MGGSTLPSYLPWDALHVSPPLVTRGRYMGGSTLVPILTRHPRTGVAPATLLLALCALSLLSVFTCFLLLISAPEGDAKPPDVAFGVFICLCAFEACLGAYMPTMATLKACYVPEDARATIYSLFRVPLNLIVVCVLLVSLDSATTFLLCSALLTVSLVCAAGAMRTIRRREASAPPYTGELGGRTPVGVAPPTKRREEHSPLVGSGKM